MTTATGPVSRAGVFVWRWCVVYTALAPRPARDRRRQEIRSHLWESAARGQSSRAVLSAAMRGMGDDLLWAASRGVPALFRSFGTPTPYVVLAPAFPIQAWIVSAMVETGAAPHLSESLGAIGGGAMLVLAGLVWLIRRARG